MAACFTPSLALTPRSTFVPAVNSSPICRINGTARGPALSRVMMSTELPPPGLPSNVDIQDGSPIQSYVPKPEETYEKRGFTTLLPRTWAGEITTIGVTDIQAEEEEAAEKSLPPVDPEASSAFSEFSRIMKEDRENALAEQARFNSVEMSGRATCGESEGRERVSNFPPIKLESTKCVEYWGAPNGPVPRLFGDS